jgi:hypothetical protein
MQELSGIISMWPVRGAQVTTHFICQGLLSRIIVESKLSIKQFCYPINCLSFVRF